MKTSHFLRIPAIGLMLLCAEVKGDHPSWLCPQIQIDFPGISNALPVFKTGMPASITAECKETEGDCNGTNSFSYKRWYWEVAGNTVFQPIKGTGATAIFTNISGGTGAVTYDLVCRSVLCPDCNSEYRAVKKFCVEDGPHYGVWNCIQPGTMSMSSMQVQPEVACLGSPISASVDLSVISGLKERVLSYDCDCAKVETDSENVSLTTHYAISGPYNATGNGKLNITFVPTNPGLGNICMWCEDNAAISCPFEPNSVSARHSYRVLKIKFKQAVITNCWNSGCYEACENLTEDSYDKTAIDWSIYANDGDNNATIDSHTGRVELDNIHGGVYSIHAKSSEIEDCYDEMQLKVIRPDIAGHEPGVGMTPGAEVPETDEDDAANIQLAVNDDNDDNAAGAHRDNQDNEIGIRDDDILAVILKPLAPMLNNGVLTLSVSPPGYVHVFSSSGKSMLTDYSVNLIAPQGNLGSLASNTVTLFVEGLEPNEDVTMGLTYSSGSFVCGDEVHLQIVRVDLDIDSDNESEFNATGWDDDEDRMEDDDTLPGKYIGVNDGDMDRDGIPNFADGYDLYGEGGSEGGPLTPIALELKEPIDLDTAKIKFIYSCSDPKDVTLTPAPTPADSDLYIPAPGHLRIWKRNGLENRKMAEVNADGDFIKSGEQYDAEDLGFESGRSVILYVEGIAPSDEMGDQQIQVEVTPDPDKTLVCRDAVRCTLLKAELVPDWNHDRTIDDKDFNHVTFKNPYRFWINDDKDDGDVANGDSDVPGKSRGNAKDDEVNGRCDLEDFSPVWINASKALNLLNSDDDWTCVLRQEGGALNFFHSKLSRLHAGNYLIEDSKSYGWSLNAGADRLPVITVPASGVDMGMYETGLGAEIEEDPEKGVIIFEGIVPTKSPLVFEIHKGDITGPLVCTAQLPLSLSGVEDMYRTVNLRNMTNPGLQEPPPNNPDSLSDGKNLVFLHGARVSERGAQGWHSELFKRLYWSGVKAKYHGITWRGDDAGLIDPLYQQNVFNAFLTAPYLSQYVGALSGSITVVAHSLGNMVVSSAIQDCGMNVTADIMLDAAVATECYDPATFNDSTNDNPMVYVGWRMYQPRTWASKWHEIFLAPDSRAKFTWQNRFPLVLSKAYNIYSSEDEVFEINPYSVGMWTGLDWDYDWGIWPDDFEHYSWQKQEVLKGRDNHSSSVIGATDWAGWGFDENIFGVRVYNADEANSELNENFRINPVFRHNPDNILTNSSADSRAVDEMLAKGIPALSFSAGATNLFSLPASRNYNMVSDKSVTWPRNHETYAARWLHSDIKDIAYLYVYPAFSKIVEKGMLQ